MQSEINRIDDLIKVLQRYRRRHGPHAQVYLLGLGDIKEDDVASAPIVPVSKTIEINSEEEAVDWHMDGPMLLVL